MPTFRWSMMIDHNSLMSLNQRDIQCLCVNNTAIPTTSGSTGNKVDFNLNQSSPLSFDCISRQSFSKGTFKAVVKDDKVLNQRFGRLVGCGLVSESSLLNLKPFSFRFAWSSSKVKIVRLGWSASRGSSFLRVHDVHMHQKERIKIIPHSVAITERVATPEPCKHINPNATRKDTIL